MILGTPPSLEQAKGVPLPMVLRRNRWTIHIPLLYHQTSMKVASHASTNEDSASKILKLTASLIRLNLAAYSQFWLDIT